MITAAAVPSRAVSAVISKPGSDKATVNRCWSEANRSARSSEITASRCWLTSTPNTRRPAAWKANAVGRPT